MNKEPIFILGYPRSGTTILQALLDTQKQFNVFPPIHFFSTIINLAQTDMSGNILNISKIEERLKADIKYDVWEETNIYKYLHSGDVTIKNLYENIIKFYTKDNDKRWVDKTPNYTYMIDIIHSYYPNAKFLYVLRNPFDAIYSRKLKLPDDKYRSIELLSQYWCNSVANYKSFKTRHPDNIMLIQYEKFSKNYIEYMKNIADFLDFELNVDLLDNYKSSISKITHKWETWKQDMTKDIMKTDNYEISNIDREIIKTITYDYLKEFGYLKDNK